MFKSHEQFWTSIRPDYDLLAANSDDDGGGGGGG